MVVDSTADSYTVSFSAWPSDFDGVRWNFYSTSWEELDHIGSSGTSTYVFSAEEKYILKYYPTGYNAYWDLGLIPDGTVISLYGNLSFGQGCDTPDPGVAVNYYDTNYNKIGSTVYTYFGVSSFDLDSISGDFTISKPAGAVYARFDIVYKNWGTLENRTVSLYGGECTFTMTIPKSVLEQSGNEAVKDVLDKIWEGTEDGNQAADDFNGSVDDMKPGADGSMDEIDSVEKPDTSDVKTDASDLVDPDGLDGATNILSTLTGLTIVNAQFIIVVTLMLAAYVLFGKRS